MADAGQKSQVALSDECNNNLLKKYVLASPQEEPGRTRQFVRLLACLGPKAASLTAAGAAYELAMYFAGADGGAKDFREAASWAHYAMECGSERVDGSRPPSSGGPAAQGLARPLLVRSRAKVESGLSGSC